MKKETVVEIFCILLCELKERNIKGQNPKLEGRSCATVKRGGED